MHAVPLPLHSHAVCELTSIHDGILSRISLFSSIVQFLNLRILKMHNGYGVKIRVRFRVRLMLYTRLALPVAVCIAKRGRNTRLAWIANPNPNPNPNPTNPIV